MSEHSTLAGEIRNWPDKTEMAQLLQRAGFQISVGKFAIRLDEFQHFVFREFGGNAVSPCITADDESLDALLLSADRVSRALAENSIRHRFEIYDGDENLAGYFHHCWPAVDGL